MTEMMSIGHKIRTLRQKLNYTQTQVDKGTGIPQSNLSEFENGKLTPSIQTLRKLSRFLEVPVSYFLCEDDIENIKSGIRICNEFSEEGKREIIDFIDFIHKKELGRHRSK